MPATDGQASLEQNKGARKIFVHCSIYPRQMTAMTEE